MIYKIIHKYSLIIYTIKDIYNKPYDQVPKEEIKRQAREVFCFGFSKEVFLFCNIFLRFF